jgi:hypothetical protein
MFNAKKAVYNLALLYKSEKGKGEIEEKPLVIHKTRISEREKFGEGIVKEKFEPFEKKKIEERKVGIQIGDIESLKGLSKKRPILLEESKEELAKINIKYPLTPPYPSKGEKVYSWGNIRWDPRSNSLVYYVIEPSITPIEKREIEKIKGIIDDKIDIRFQLLKSGERSN